MENAIREKILGQTFYRKMALDRASVSEKDRTVRVSFSSEMPVARYFGNEILDHRKESVNLERLKSGAPVLVDHDGDQVGVVQKSWIDSESRKGYAVLKFSQGARGQEIFKDIQDEIRQNTSVGYSIEDLVPDPADETGETFRATKWTPHEISIVSVPADFSVGVGRSLKNERTNSKMENENTEVLNRAGRRELVNQERERLAEIMIIAEKYGEKELAREYVSEGKESGAFAVECMKRKGTAKPIQTMPGPEIGMSGREMNQFSIRKAIADIALGNGLTGIEKEASDSAGQKYGRALERNTVHIPEDILRAPLIRPNARALEAMGYRSLAAGNSPAGGYTVDSDVLGGNLIELLRNQMVISRLGAMNLSGLSGNVSIPKQSGAATVSWLAESQPVTPTDQQFGQIILTPKKAVGATAYSKELMVQSSVDIEGFIRMDLLTILAIAKDAAAINGLGAAGQPAGIMNTTGIGTVTFGAAASWAKVLSFESTIATSNALKGNPGYLTTPNTRGKWKGNQKATNYPSYLWEGTSREDGSGTVNGYPAYATLQVPGDKVIFGNWNDLIVADWAGIDIVVDPYSLSLNGQVRCVVTILTDVGVRHPVSFCVSTDSGAQ